MPRIVTMNGDHRWVATAPLDLSTTHREHGSSGSRSPGCKPQAGGDALVSRGSPAPPACTGTDTLEIQWPAQRGAPEPRSSGARKRPPASHSSKLPFRKRPIVVEAETRRQSPPPEAADRPSLAERTVLTPSKSLERGAEDSRSGAATPSWAEDAKHSPNPYPVCFIHPFNYGPFPTVLCLPPVHQPEPNHHLVNQLENSYHFSISLATRQDEDGDTALHIAVVQGEFAFVCKLIHLLLLAHRSLDIYNNLRQTPLHLAVITKQANMVEALLRAGSDPSALDRNGQTALHLCCEYDQQDCLSVVLSQSSATTCLEVRNYEGLSPLHVAVLRGRKDLAQMLLDAGADINAMDIKSGQNPLMHAVESNKEDMVYFLIENGCDVNCRSYSGNTALHGACGRGQVDTVRFLLKSGADSSLKNYHNDTPVMVAKNKKIADVLRGRGSKLIRVQDQHCLPVPAQASSLTENGHHLPAIVVDPHL